MPLQVYTLKARPDLRPHVFSAEFRPPFWPEFMLHDPVARLYFAAPLFDEYLDFALAAVVEDKVVARAFSVPFAFGIPARVALPDGGWDEVIRWAHEDRLVGRQPTAVSALEISILPQARRAGNAQRILAAMKANARKLGFSDLYAPVRPTEKHLHPSLPITEYANLTRADGLPQDAWLRTHVRAGGRIIKTAPYAMTIIGTVADWCQWANMTFTSTGLWSVPGALSQVYVSLEGNVAIYIEPGIWVHHPL
jgi:GNAT superfamily N-acetyltransferase